MISGDAEIDVVLAREYSPYGEIAMHSGNGKTDYGFTGEMQAGGLVHLRARDYATTDGRFLTRDSWEGNYSRPLSLNKWMYVEGNPVNRTDPSGRCYGPLSFLRNVPVESGICEHLDQAMFVYLSPRSIPDQRGIATVYVGGWIYGHLGLVVGVGGLAVAGGQAAIAYLTELYIASQFAQRAGQACNQLESYLPSWRLPQQSSKVTIDFLENQIGRVNHIMDEKHAWDLLLSSHTDNLQEGYRMIQPILRQVVSTTGQPVPYSTNSLGPVFKFVSTINGYQVVVTAVKISENALQITDAWVITK